MTSNCISRNEIKVVQIKLIDEIKSFCSRNGLTFFLAYGTLLGSIRHNGYIPWDDDIDIMLPRNDYNKLIKLYESHDFTLFSFEKDNNYLYPFAKLSDNNSILVEKNKLSKVNLGINIDIFPLDYLPNNPFKRFFFMLKNLFYRTAYISKEFSNNNHKNIFKKFVYNRMEKRYRKSTVLDILKDWDAFASSIVGSKYCGCCVWGYKFREVHKAEIFFPPLEHKFENNVYPIPNKYDIYLRKIYGNYLKLPPVIKRVTHHEFIAEKRVKK